MTAEDLRRKQEAERLYEKYGKPLEAEHQGQYLAISPEGQTLLGPTLLEVLKQARRRLKKPGFIWCHPNMLWLTFGVDTTSRVTPVSQGGFSVSS